MGRDLFATGVWQFTEEAFCALMKVCVHTCWLLFRLWRNADISGDNFAIFYQTSAILFWDYCHLWRRYCHIWGHAAILGGILP